MAGSKRAKRTRSQAVRRPRADRQTWAWAVVANLAILTVYAGFAWLSDSSADSYYRAVQEDEPLEWASFWAFLLAGAVFARAAWRRRHRWPWFLLLVAMFCLFVAGEEISWGQRLLGFRPPEYFLAENFQQELNLHNLVDTGLRKLGLRLVILAYGVLLPMLSLGKALRRWLEGLGVVAPSWKLMPAFIAMERIYTAYPLRFTGEVVEMMLGLGLLIAALALVRSQGEMTPAAGAEGTDRGKRWWSRLPPFAVPAIALVVVFVLGTATAATSQALVAGDEARLAQAQREAEALRDDFRQLGAGLGRRSVSQCNLSKRVYTFMEEFEAPALLEGSFAALTGQWVAEERAAFFLDPWNNPWWIRDRCDPRAGVRRAFLYSFGPNKRRDSSYWEIQGDDVGAYIVEIGTLPAWLTGQGNGE